MRTIDIIEDVLLFSDLTMEELALIEPLCGLVEGKAGDCLIREGECVLNVYVLLSGEAIVKKKRADGKQIPLDHIRKGDLVGEVTFFKQTPAPAPIQAPGPFPALDLKQKEFRRLLDAHPALGLKIYKKFARILSVRIKMRLDQFVESVSKI